MYVSTTDAARYTYTMKIVNQRELRSPLKKEIGKRKTGLYCGGAKTTSYKMEQQNENVQLYTKLGPVPIVELQHVVSKYIL